MKRLLALVAAAYAVGAQAAPHLYGDVVVGEGVTHCGMVLDGAAKVTAPIVTGQCKFDLASVPVGQHTVTLTAIVIDPVWGNQESAPSLPFVFVKPTAPSVPTSLQLKP